MKTSLTLAYSDSAKAYCELVSSLHDSANRLSDDQYTNLFAAIEQWRMRTEKDRLALQRHVRQHDC